MPCERLYSTISELVNSYFGILFQQTATAVALFRNTLKDKEMRAYCSGVHALRGCGPALDRLCRERGFSRADVARLLKISPSGVTAMFGPDAWPNSRRIDELLTAIGADAHDFARALDQVNRRGQPEMASEVREASPEDPLDQLLTSFNGQLRALVQEVKRRSPKV